MTAIRKSLTRWSQPFVLAVGFAVLVAANVASLWLLTRSQSNYQHVVHTLDVENKLSNLLRVLRRAESSQRGYLLTQAPEYLTDYRDTVASIPLQIQEIREKTADNPVQQQLLSTLEEPVRARLDALAKVVAVRDEAGLGAAVKLMQAETGRMQIEEAQKIVQRMGAEEARILRERTGASEATMYQLFAVNLGGSIFILALGIAAVLIVRRSSRERDEANAQLASANFDLEASIAERTAELEEANQELQRYAYIVSHDLRSPLVNIMGFTTELEELRPQLFASDNAGAAGGETAQTEKSELEQNYEEALGFIKASITRMDNLIHAILRVSREGQRQFKPETIDMTISSMPSPRP